MLQRKNIMRQLAQPIAPEYASENAPKALEVRLMHQSIFFLANTSKNTILYGKNIVSNLAHPIAPKYASGNASKDNPFCLKFDRL